MNSEHVAIRAVLKARIEARAALAELRQAVELIHPKLMQLLSRDGNHFQPCA